MTSNTAIGIAGTAICVVFILVIKVQTKLAKQKREQLQREWRQKIEQLADDRSADPDGLSLDDVMDLLDQSFWQDICTELEKMPRGRRSLRQAIEIADKDDDRLSA